MFDEAHHLTAYRTGGKVRKTENYKLAEALKDHSRDLLLLSATPVRLGHSASDHGARARLAMASLSVKWARASVEVAPS